MTESGIPMDTSKTGARAPVLRSPVRFWAGLILMLVGCIGLAIPFVSFTVANNEGVLIEGISPIASASGVVIDDNQDRLVIEGIGVSMPLIGGRSSDYGLSKGAWLWPDTKQPGQQGNTVIFGHRFRYLPPLSNTLFSLDKAKIGDEITIRRNRELLRYRIIESRVTVPTDLSVLDDSRDERITIVTCHPVWSTKERLVVVAVRIPAQ
jgi:LPXTG-site transpeptidase (sortase) family protein